MSTRGFFLGDKATEGVKLTTHIHLVPRSRRMQLCLHSPIHLHGVVLLASSCLTISCDNFEAPRVLKKRLSDSHFWGPGFISRPEGHIFWLRCFVGRAVVQAVSRQLPTSEARFEPRSNYVEFVVDKVVLGRSSPSTSAYLANSHFTNCSTITIIYHPWLVQ
jgi:hypothetical protein